MVSPVFVGRRKEQEALRAALESTRGGEPSFVVIGGEAGVGKTRLVQEALTHDTDSGFAVLVGQSVELGSDGLPLAPVIGALRALVRQTQPEDLPALLGPALRGLARLLPELAEVSGDVALAPADPLGEVVQPAQMLELLLGVLGRLSATRPVLLVLEDLHWADRSTLQLLAYLMRTLRGVRVMLVLTYRSDEMHRSHPLRPLLSEWDRVRSVQRLELPRFARAEVREQLEAILGPATDADVVDTVFERSGGNAFLVEEIVELVRRGGDLDDLPPSLRQVLMARIDALDQDAQRLLRTASVAGRQVSDPLLSAVCGLDELALSEALRQVVENHWLVVDDGIGGYAFRHALVRDALYEDMLPRERIRLHETYAGALEADPQVLGPSAAPAALAYHCYASLDLPRALSASVEAAEYAHRSFAPAEALLHLERVLELWPRVPDAESRAGLSQLEVARRAADAAYRSGQLDRALSLLDEALAEHLPGEDDITHALMLVSRASYLRDLSRDLDGIKVLEEALTLLPEGDTLEAHAVVLAALANAYQRLSYMSDASRLALPAVAAAQTLGRPDQEAEALITLGGTQVYGGSAEAGLVTLRDGLTLALRIDAPMTALRAYVNLSDSLEAMGRHADAAEVAATGNELAVRTGLTQIYGAYLTGNRVESLMHLGRWDDVDRMLAEALEGRPVSIFAGTLYEIQAELAVMRGRYDQVSTALAQARRAMGHNVGAQYLLPLAFVDGALQLSRGDQAAAASAVEHALVDDAAAAFDTRYSWPLVWLGWRSCAEAVTFGAAAGAGQDVPDSTRELLDRLLEELAESNPPCAGFAAMARGERARAEGRTDVGAWEDAVQRWRDIGERYYLAYALLRQAEAEWADGLRGEATAHLSEARAVATGLGALEVRDSVDALARAARINLDQSSDGQGETASPLPAPPGSPLDRLGLTGREQEVLALLADGQSNKDIARALFISPKTASVHVSNILAKLGVSTRGQAAALAHRLA